MVPWDQLSPHPKCYLDLFSGFCGAPNNQSYLPGCAKVNPMLGPPEYTTQMACQSVQSCLQRSPHSVPIVLKHRLLPSNFPLPMGDLDPHLIHGSLAHPSPQPNGILVGAAVFAGHTTVTDRQTTLLGRKQHAASTYVVLRCGQIIIIPQ